MNPQVMQALANATAAVQRYESLVAARPGLQAAEQQAGAAADAASRAYTLAKQAVADNLKAIGDANGDVVAANQALQDALTKPASNNTGPII
jgi:hypothetical protein